MQRGCRARRASWNFARERPQSPTKLRLSSVYQRLLSPFMLVDARKRRGLPNISFRTIGWFPMDTSHLAANAGAASSFFASIFVVATLSMRTMIPLRVFAILTNIVLIATAIPLRNYPTLLLHAVAAAAQLLSAAPDAAAGARREEIGQQRPVDGVAEALHDRAQMRGRRNAVLQGREGRGDALHRQRPVQAGRIRYRIAGRGHRRRDRHAVAVECANPDAGVHRSRA